MIYNQIVTWTAFAILAMFINKKLKLGEIGGVKFLAMKIQRYKILEKSDICSSVCAPPIYGQLFAVFEFGQKT